MSDTPRTDAAGRGWSPLHGAFCYVHEDVARQLERELAEAQKNYQFMVDRAANEKLDGYRELGAKAAAAEERAEKAERELAKAKDLAWRRALQLDDMEKQRDAFEALYLGSGGTEAPHGKYKFRFEAKIYYTEQRTMTVEQLLFFVDGSRTYLFFQQDKDAEPRRYFSHAQSVDLTQEPWFFQEIPARM